MAIDPSAVPQSRRALLAGALGGLAAAVATTLGRPSPANAAAGSTMIIGSEANNAGSANTQLLANSNVVAFKLLQNGPGTALMGYATPATGATRGVYGRTDSPNGYGVQARSAGAQGTGAAIQAIGVNNTGVDASTDNGERYAVKGVNNGDGGAGVYGTSITGAGVYGTAPSGYGVFGTTNDGYGVYGYASGGHGVHGRTDTPNGYGVQARCAGAQGTGAAIQAIGVNNHGIDASTDGANRVAINAVHNGNSGTAIHAVSTGGVTISAVSTSAAAISGSSTSWTGVNGNSSSAAGVHGISGTGAGIRGFSGSGYAGEFDGRVKVSQYVDVVEMTNPGLAPADTARLFVRDNGGKTELCVIFPTGSTQIIKTEV